MSTTIFPPSAPADSHVYAGIEALMKKTENAFDHVAEAQEVVRRLCGPGADASWAPWPKLLSSLQSASNFLDALADDMDSSIAEASIAVCPTQLCADPNACKLDRLCFYAYLGPRLHFLCLFMQ